MDSRYTVLAVWLVSGAPAVVVPGALDSEPQMRDHTRSAWDLLGSRIGQSKGTRMFGKEESSGPMIQTGLNSILGKGARFKGTFEGAGTLRVESELDGTIKGADSVVIGKTGIVRGEIHAKQVVVSGRVEGRIVATEKLELQSESHVQADVISPRLIISEGVFFEGNCKMREDNAEDSIPLQGSGTDLSELPEETTSTWQQMAEKNLK